MLPLVALCLALTPIALAQSVAVGNVVVRTTPCLANEVSCEGICGTTSGNATDWQSSVGSNAKVFCCLTSGSTCCPMPSAWPATPRISCNPGTMCAGTSMSEITQCVGASVPVGTGVPVAGTPVAIGTAVPVVGTPSVIGSAVASVTWASIGSAVGIVTPVPVGSSSGSVYADVPSWSYGSGSIGRISAGAIAGIVIGVIVLLLAVCACCCILYRRRRAQGMMVLPQVAAAPQVVIIPEEMRGEKDTDKMHFGTEIYTKSPAPVAWVVESKASLASTALPPYDAGKK